MCSLLRYHLYFGDNHLQAIKGTRLRLRPSQQDKRAAIADVSNVPLFPTTLLLVLLAAYDITGLTKVHLLPLFSFQDWKAPDLMAFTDCRAFLVWEKKLQASVVCHFHLSVLATHDILRKRH